jgi:hypothetical protein
LLDEALGVNSLGDMQYHLGRGSQPLGQFTEEEVRLGLAEGRFLTTDLGWLPGMTEWKPLSQFVELHPKPDPALPPVVLPPVTHEGIGVMPAPGTALASVVLGIISLVTCTFGLLFFLPGLICGHIALKQIDAAPGRYEGRGLAVTGLVLNYAWLAIAVLVIGIFLFIATFAETGSSGSKSWNFEFGNQ